MAAQEVTQILLNAQSPNGPLRNTAEETLKQFREHNLPSFLLSLSQELANNYKPPESRKLAGLVLKNSLEAEQWVALNPTVKCQVKATLLHTLSSPVADVRHTSAQVIAKLAAVELWPELVGLLLDNMQAGQTHVKQATLEALGYVCEEAVTDSLLTQDEVNGILTAVVQGVQSSEPSNDVRFAGAHALYNALDFAGVNFGKGTERDYIMRVDCEACSFALGVRVRQAAFECLDSIGSIYYNKLGAYMGDILAITSKVVKEDEEPEALQAIEFWSTVCDEEIEKQDSEVPGFQFIKKALPALVPMLLETLTKQEEEEEREEGAWNLAMAGGISLGLVAQAVGDDVLPLVMPFVYANVANPDWRSREAATTAFGSILEGPYLEKLTPLVNVALDFMLRAMRDENNHVKETTAWTLGRIFDCRHGVITQSNLPFIIAVLRESIKDSPNVAEKVCGAIYHLAQDYGDLAGQASSPLSTYFQSIVQALLATTKREDSEDSRLRTVAYEALNEFGSQQRTLPLISRSWCP